MQKRKITITFIYQSVGQPQKCMQYSQIACETVSGEHNLFVVSKIALHIQFVLQKRLKKRCAIAYIYWIHQNSDFQKLPPINTLYCCIGTAETSATKLCSHYAVQWRLQWDMTQQIFPVTNHQESKCMEVRSQGTANATITQPGLPKILCYHGRNLCGSVHPSCTSLYYCMSWF